MGKQPSVFNALAFDIIGDLAFGAPFGMIDRDAADTVPITRESRLHVPKARTRLVLTFM
jgi:benzoate 4-monooxygenase